MTKSILEKTELIAVFATSFRSKEEAQRQNWLAQQAAFSVELCSGAVKERGFIQANYFLVNQMAQHLGCSQVVIGRVNGDNCHLTAISGMAKFNRRTPLVAYFEEAMSETLRAKRDIEYPQQQHRVAQVDIAHKKLLEITKAARVLSLPLLLDDQIVGVWLFLWQPEQLPISSEKDLILAVTPCLGPVLDISWRAREGVVRRVLGSIRRHSYKWRFLAFIVIAVALIGALTLPFSHYVHGRYELQPATRRIIAVPFQGILWKTYAKQGDLVQEQQLLAELDGKELRWELAGLEAEKAKIDKEIELGLVQREIAKFQMAKLEAEKLQVRIGILRYRLQNLEIRAPIAGIVISGDLERVHGIPVQTGEILFELAPLQEMVAEIAVEARDISHLKAGMDGEITLELNPVEYIPIVVRDIRPAAETKDSANVFICQANIENAQSQMRPGIEGRARIYTGEKPLWWVLFHRPISWVRMRIWR